MSARAAVALAPALAIAGALAWRLFSALPAEVRRQQVAPCRALDPRPVDRPAGGFRLADAAGRPRALEEWRGKTVLVNFWATWCPPCIEELPAIEGLARALRGSAFDLVAVSVDDGWEVVRKFFADRGTPLDGDGTAAAPLTVLLDPGGQVSRRWGTSKFPESYLIDPEGNIVYHFVNQRDWDSAEALACVRSVMN